MATILSAKTMRIEDIWSSLRRETAEAQRRIDETHPLDLYADFAPPDRPGLLLLCDERPSDPVPLKAISLHRGRRQDGRWSLRICLEEPRLILVFGELCRDIVEFTRHGSPNAEPSGLMLSRIERWRSLLQAQPAGLSRNRLKGLIGELLILEQELLPALGPDQAVSAWTGPLGTCQDFHLPDGRRLEVKALDHRARHVHINGLGQLDSGTDPLDLVVVRLEDAQRGTEGTITARNLVDGIRRRLASAPAAFEAFQQLLEFAAWDDAADDEAVAVRLERVDRYQVDNSFPRLTAATVPTPVVDASYKILLPQPTANS